MRLRFIHPLWILFALSLPAFAQTRAAPSALEQRMAVVLPTEAEDRWLQIPWRANVMEARAEAERQRKPLFMFVMDGNPLGCG